MKSYVGPTVTDFIIVPPEGRPDILARMKDRLEAHMGARHPQYSFRYASLPFVEEDDFVIVPIMSTRGDGDAIIMCRPVEPEIIHQLQASLHEFLTLSPN